MNTHPLAGRPVRLTAAGLMAVASTLVVLAVSGTHEGHAASGHSHRAAASIALVASASPSTGSTSGWTTGIPAVTAST